MKSIRRTLMKWLSSLPQGVSQGDILQAQATLFILLCRQFGKSPREVLDSNAKLLEGLNRHPELRAIRMYLTEEMGKRKWE